MMNLFRRKKERPVGGWYDITLDQFNKVKKLDLNEMSDQIEAAEILLGIDGSKMTWADFCKEITKLDFMKEPVPKILIKKQYILNGRTYNCLPNVRELDVARYMDFMNLSKKKEVELEKVLAIFLIEDGKEYGQDIEQTYNDILTMSIVDVMALSNFFKLELIASLKTMKDYSVDQMKGNKELQKVTSAIMEYYFTSLDLLNGLT